MFRIEKKNRCKFEEVKNNQTMKKVMLRETTPNNPLQKNERLQKNNSLISIVSKLYSLQFKFLFINIPVHIYKKKTCFPSSNKI